VVVVLWVSFSLKDKGGPKDISEPPISKNFITTKNDTLKINTIDSVFTNLHLKNRFNGVVLFAKEGKVLFQKAMGYASFKKKDTLSLNHAFQLASISKTITAIGVLRLLDKGLLDLDDSVQKFIPEFPYHNITIKNLLSHRSGLPNYMYFSDKYWPSSDSLIYIDDVLCLMENKQPEVYYMPNRRYNYCNTNYAVLSKIIVSITKIPFDQYMKEEVFDIAGMKDAFVLTFDEVQSDSNIAIGHEWRRKVGHSYLDGVKGDKGIYCSVLDLLQLDKALYDTILLKQKTIQLAYEPIHRDLYKSDNYGLGWRLNLADTNNVFVYHSGWWHGFKTAFIRNISNKNVLIVLSNSTSWRNNNSRFLQGLIKE